jgi:hypothetical protein
MAKQKYKPLDLSFIANRYSPQRDSIANTAAMIMANAGWGPSNITLQEMKQESEKAEKAQRAAHRQTFLSSVIDLLSTPLHGVANAMDEALAGHQSDSNDSVGEDILKTVGGVFTGAPKGLVSGLRGASGILDVLPGVDIDDEWQSDPTDKTHFSDVAIRKSTGMATADAMKPENWAKIQPKLEAINEKSLWDKTAFELAIPDDLSDPEAREKYFRNQMLTGIASDIGGDPLNLLFFGGGSAARAAKATQATKGLTEGLDSARAGAEMAEAIKSGLNSKASTPFVPKADLNMPSPVGAIAEPAEIAAGMKIPIASVSPETEKVIKTLENMGRREPKKRAAMAVGGKDQHDIIKRIVAVASSGDSGWMYKAADILREHPNVTWTETEKLLQKANSVIKKIGHRGVRGLAPALRKRIAADVRAAKPAEEIVRRTGNIAGEMGEDVYVQGGKIFRGAPQTGKLKRSEAILANKVIGRFEPEILGRKGAPGTGEGLARAIAAGDNVRYSGPQQARMWNQITTNLKFANEAKFAKATRILRAVENYYITKGMIPHSAAKTAQSVPLRLSQVAEAIGPEILGKSHAFITGILRGDPKALAQLSDKQVEAINALKQSEAIAAAPAVQSGMSAARDVADTVAKARMSVARKKQNTDTLIRNIKEFTAASGGGDVGAHVVGEYMGNLLGKSDVINKALNANKLKTEAWLAKTGRPGARHFLANDPEFVRSVTNAIGKAANLPNPAQLGRLSGPAARVTDWLGARFNAAYGVQDMRPIFLKQQASAMSTTGRRAKLINDLGRRFSPRDTDLWHEAFRAAQQNGVTDGRVAELQKEISAAMENLFGGTGLRNGAIADSTVVGRNRILMDELNKNLRRFGLGKFQFEAKKVTDAAGVEHDFSKGLDWMKSWEAWDVKNPYQFLHQVQNAIEFTVREKNMFDEIVSRFASPAKKGGVKYGVNHPRLRGYFFTEEGAKQAQVFVRMLEEVSTPNSKTLQHFDHVLSKLKAALTIYIPGHHMTNLIGDVYYNWIAGVNKPIRYEQAMKVMLAQKGRYGTFAEFEKLTGPKALEQAVARSMVKPDAGLSIPAAGNKVIVTMPNGTKVTADMIYTAAYREGILPSARVLEDVTSDVSTVLDKFRPLGGKGQRAVHTVSEIRDHIPRLAQFIDGLAKHGGDFASASRSTARAVRKWHPDGLDLTKFERNFMKRVFPFYSWTRKAIPLAIEATIFAGPKVMAYPRLMEAIALSNGIDPENQTRDPFPTDQLFPDWIRDRGIGPIMGGPGNYTVINPSTPILDTLALIGHPGQSGIDMLNPMLKVPVETMQGQTLGRNVPIGNTNQEWVDYAAKQIPIASQLGRASGQFGVSDSTKAEGFPNWTNIINLMTGAKRVDTGKYVKSGQFDLRDYLKQLREQNK